MGVLSPQMYETRTTLLTFKRSESPHPSSAVLVVFATVHLDAAFWKWLTPKKPPIDFGKWRGKIEMEAVSLCPQHCPVASLVFAACIKAWVRCRQQSSKECGTYMVSQPHNLFLDVRKRKDNRKNEAFGKNEKRDLTHSWYSWSFLRRPLPSRASVRTCFKPQLVALSSYFGVIVATWLLLWAAQTYCQLKCRVRTGQRAVFRRLKLIQSLFPTAIKRPWITW